MQSIQNILNEKGEIRVRFVIKTCRGWETQPSLHLGRVSQPLQ